MALNNNAVKAEADAFATLANEAAILLSRIEQLLEHNSDLAIDWAAGTTPAYITEDLDGNLDGYNFSRQEVSNAVFSLDQIRNLFINAAVTQGDHLGNVSKLARPLG